MAKQTTEEKSIHRRKEGFPPRTDIQAQLREYRREQRGIVDENRMFSAMLDALPAFVCLYYPDYSISYVNKFCKKIFGEPGSKTCFRYFRNRETPCLQCPLKKVLDTKISTTRKMKTESPARTFQVTDSPFVDGDGNVLLLSIGIDITENMEVAARLRNGKEELELQIEERTNELQRKNIALTEVLSHLEIEKENLAQKVEVNVQKVLLPVIEKLIEKSSSIDSRYLVLIKQNLERLTSSIGLKLSNMEYNLTPKEIELCALIKGGFSIKEIAAMQNLSERTVETHRLNIRRKLGLSSAKTNLAAYLSHL
jgi:DNA-binding CsgD family transcriptional regulator